MNTASYSCSSRAELSLDSVELPETLEHLRMDQKLYHKL